MAYVMGWAEHRDAYDPDGQLGVDWDDRMPLVEALVEVVEDNC
jgi:hypothetical protein